MENGKLGFEDFIAAVDKENEAFVRELHTSLLRLGCRIEVKTAKSGHLVSYLFENKALANYVFRKKGLLIRIYANHVNQYMDFLDTLPDGMLESIRSAPVCKRLIDPNTCNSRCPMGYDFSIRGEHFKKCRNNAFLFLMCEENNSFVRTFLTNEAKVYV